MEESSLIRLHLRMPLLYEEMPGLEPFACAVPDSESAGELLFCFELDPEQAGRIDPEPERFLEEAVFCGKGNGGQGSFELSAGLYLFVQRREALNREACIRLAIEQQKDGLWERLKPGNRLYIRHLFEDGRPVTQLLRELSLREK